MKEFHRDNKDRILLCFAPGYGASEHGGKDIRSGTHSQEARAPGTCICSQICIAKRQLKSGLPRLQSCLQLIDWYFLFFREK